ncbi:MAG: hypothetical protein RJA35_778 [Actinomycetota bacterium]|jgi:polar amino acid transport system substrate-binding protein
MKKIFAVTSALAATALFLSVSASGAATAASNSTVSVDKAAAALLPAKYKSAGINVGSDIPYAPMEMFDANNKPIGFDVDLINAVAAKLGTKAIVQKQSFDSLIPSLQAGKHDVAVSSMSDTTDRQAKLTFVDYFNGGASLLVAKGNPSKIKGLGDTCGKTVAFEAATWEGDLIKAQAATCKKAGKPAVIALSLPGDTDAQSAVRAGKAVGYLADSQLAAYTVKKAGNGTYFDLVIDPTAPNGYESGLIGIGVLKSNTGLVKAIQAGLQSFMNDGGYDKLLAKWNLESFKVPSATVNGTK